LGKRILQRHRGKGGLQYRAPQIGKFARVRYPFVPQGQTAEARILDIVHERGRAYPLAELDVSGKKFYVPAVSGMSAGALIQIGPQANVAVGNVLPLANIPEGTTICNIERYLGDGGRFVRQAGESAILFANTPQGSTIRLPSGRTTFLSPKCRASIGIVSGGGRVEKPLLRAGAKYHLMKSKGKMYPRMRGIAMAAVYHPFGGGRHQHPGKSTSTSRNAPPGRKVGNIAPRKTGRKRIPRTDISTGQK
jgi:large subunit ribosomal protein L2